MHTIRTIIFDPQERDVLDRANSLITIAFPLASDPLTPAGRGVEKDDPRLRVMSGLANGPWDPVSHSRLTLAEQTLVELLAVVSREADPAYWEQAARDSEVGETDMSRSLGAVLATERARQVPVVQEALDLVRKALSGLSERDNSQFWKAAYFEA